MTIKQTALTLGSLGLMFGGILAIAPAASALECSILPKDICDSADKGQLDQSGTWKLLILVLNILTALVGIVAIGALGFAGFLYASASNDSGQVTKAKEMIRNVLIGVVAYAFMYVLLQYLIPGGVFT